MPEVPDTFWLVRLADGSQWTIDDASATVLATDLRTGIVEFSELLDLVGAPLMVRLDQVTLLWQQTSEGRAMSRAIDEFEQAEGGFRD